MIEKDPYAEIAPFYDLEFNSVDADVEMYLGYASMVGSPILELGCGSGRLLEPIAAAGYEITGIDNSPKMVERAISRLSERFPASAATAQAGDMRDLSAFEAHSFRLIFSAINSFLHLPSQEDQMRSLRSIRSVLDRDGLLILDLFHPTPETLRRLHDRYALDAIWHTEDGRRIERFSYRQLDVAEQTIHTTLIYDVVALDGSVTRRTTRYDTRYVHRFEMEALIELTGFELEGIYGSYQLDPFDADSEQMVFVMHRTANYGED
jgi:SAM-dependent methyltransferase